MLGVYQFRRWRVFNFWQALFGNRKNTVRSRPSARHTERLVKENLSEVALVKRILSEHREVEFYSPRTLRTGDRCVMQGTQGIFCTAGPVEKIRNVA